MTPAAGGVGAVARPCTASGRRGAGLGGEVRDVGAVQPQVGVQLALRVGLELGAHPAALAPPQQGVLDVLEKVHGPISGKAGGCRAFDVAGLFDGPALMEVAPAVGRAIHYAAMQHPIKYGG